MYNDDTHTTPDLDFAMANLDQLAPQERADKPSVHAAHQRFHTETKNSGAFTNSVSRTPNRTTNMNRKWIGGTILATLALVIAFSFPGPRALASNMLGVFRVQKFAAISVSPQQLEVIGEVMEDGVFPGEFTDLSEGQHEFEEFTSFADASDYLWKTDTFNSWGFRTLDTLGEPTDVSVQSGGKGILNLDVEASRKILSAVDVDPSILPDSIDGADINVEVYKSLAQSWKGVDYIQMPSPTIDYPSDVDPALIGSAVLQFMGMDEREANRLASNIDWTNTLLMPIPADFATFSEVRLGDTTGLALEALDGSGTTLIFERNGIINLLIGMDDTYDTEALIDLASQ